MLENRVALAAEQSRESLSSTAVKVESGIPLPAGTRKGPRPIYPWDQMKIGDSFLVPPDKKIDSFRRAAAVACRKRAGWKFSVINTESGYRCWRVA
jgi:hypothetical protein